jgi:hypothetical protein
MGSVKTAVVRPFLVGIMVSVPFALLSAWILDRERVDPDFFAVIAQVIPVLVLAFLLETRESANALLRTKSDLQQTFRQIERSRRSIGGQRDSSTKDPEEFLVGDALDEETELASLEVTVQQAKLANVSAVVIAGMGETVALASLAAERTDPWLYSFGFSTVLLLGVLLVLRNRISMEATVLRARASTHRVRAEEVWAEYFRLKGQVEALVERERELREESPGDVPPAAP